MPSFRFPRSPCARRSASCRILALAAAALLTGCLDRPVAPLTPQTTNVFVDSVEQQSVDKIDLLFMIDNSISMADKQVVLKNAVPDLMRRLVNPVCVDSEGNQHDPPSNPRDDCPAGQSREFSPIGNIHVGVVTSSLGASASDTCSAGEEDNDHGLMLGVRPRAAHLGLGASHGFLVWRPGQGGTTDDIEQFNTLFSDLVAEAGERGCGFEESLEGWYRFLVEPEPPEGVGRAPCPGQPNQECAQAYGLNQEVLRQRAAFLRSDSLLAIIMLSDEDDCSTPITGQSWLALQYTDLPRGTSVCESNPNDPCCHSCGQAVPEGCQHDSLCDEPLLPRAVDHINQRCFAQKQRFGIDFKYPTDRYVNALSRQVLCNHPRVPDLDDRKCPSEEHLFRNPIYADLTNQGGMTRTSDRVFIAAIVGVPWQNLQAATDEEGNPYPEGELHYKTYEQMVRDGTWDDILGDPKASPPIPPLEPLMWESLAPRGGTTRSTGELLAGPGAGPMENSINGHEWWNSKLDDLQYACIFPLPEERNCMEYNPDEVGCDCHPKNLEEGDNNPLCQDPVTGQYDTIQRYAKAYPGPRFLQVARDYGDRSIVASICARNLDRPEARDYGYRPAIAAIVDRLKLELTGSCLPRRLTVDPELDGDVPCYVVEAALDGNLCSLPGREPANASPEGSQLIDPIRARLEDRGVCGGANQPSCLDYTLCTVKPAQPQDRCLASDADKPEGTSPGWCYVDPEQGRGNPDIVADCPPTRRRLLRFVGENTPAQGARVFVACLGADLGEGASARTE